MQFKKVGWSVAFLGIGMFAATTPQAGANTLNPVYGCGKRTNDAEQPEYAERAKRAADSEQPNKSLWSE